jgi:hypothetical protein
LLALISYIQQNPVICMRSPKPLWFAVGGDLDALAANDNVNWVPSLVALVGVLPTKLLSPDKLVKAMGLTGNTVINSSYQRCSWISFYNDDLSDTPKYFFNSTTGAPTRRAFEKYIKEYKDAINEVVPETVILPPPPTFQPPTPSTGTSTTFEFCSPNLRSLARDEEMMSLDEVMTILRSGSSTQSVAMANLPKDHHEKILFAQLCDKHLHKTLEHDASFKYDQLNSTPTTVVSIRTTLSPGSRVQFMADKLTLILEAHGYEIERGAELLTKELFLTHLNAAIAGALSAGIAVFAGRLTSYASGAWKAALNITDKCYLTLNALLKHSFGSFLLAPLSKIKDVTEKNAEDVEFGSVEVVGEEGEKDLLVEFWYQNSWIDTVKKGVARRIQHNKTTPFGFKMGDGSKAVVVVFSADGGGGSVKGGVSVHCFNDDQSPSGFKKLTELQQCTCPALCIQYRMLLIRRR